MVTHYDIIMSNDTAEYVHCDVTITNDIVHIMASQCIMSLL